MPIEIGGDIRQVILYLKTRMSNVFTLFRVILNRPVFGSYILTKCCQNSVSFLPIMNHVYTLIHQENLVKMKSTFFDKQMISPSLAKTKKTATKIWDALDQYLPEPLKREDGIVTRHNGIDIMQTDAFIRVHCKTYINKICKTKSFLSIIFISVQLHYNATKNLLRNLKQNQDRNMFRISIDSRRNMDLNIEPQRGNLFLQW